MKITVWTFTDEELNTTVCLTEDEAKRVAAENWGDQFRTDVSHVITSHEIEVPGYEPAFVYGCIPLQSVEDYIKVDAEDGEGYDLDLNLWNTLGEDDKALIASYAAEQAGEAIAGETEYDAVRAAFDWFRELDA